MMPSDVRPDASSGAVDLSVMICTWNNCRRLATTLAAIARCAVPAHLRWELVLVNNSCTDRTADIARAFADRLPLVYVEEPRPGLSQARNAGLKVASGRLIVFNDDDVTPSREWLAAYWEAYQAKPAGQYFGGPITCEREVEALDGDLLDLANPSLAGLDWGTNPRALSQNEYFLGANWACPADALRAVGDFDVRLGLDSSLGRRRLGEECDLMDRLRRLGASAWYLPQAQVVHFVPKAKCSLAYMAANAEAGGVYAATGAATILFLHRRPGLRSRYDQRSRLLPGLPLGLAVEAVRLACRWGLERARGNKGYEEYLCLRFCLGVLKGHWQRMGEGLARRTANLHRHPVLDGNRREPRGASHR